ncbi:MULTISPECIES: TRAP transporter small permease [Pseudooceanicola]|uniref:TRAP transporter small permease n=1 Tax=Pseudooceanicola TaxID=1679449 RepID=UPI002880727F|nr:MULTISPECIES: TRAP transporter small permease [Pseudooceanicola]
MTHSKTLRSLSVITDRATHALSVVAGVLLLAMVVIIAWGVISRYFLGAPILGLNEIVQLNAVALAMLALPYATSSGVHVRADIFDRLIGWGGRFLGDILTRCLSILVLYHLTERAWYKAMDALEFGDTTNMLALPLWPFYALMAFGMGLCILVFAVQLITIIANRGAGDD